jgi:TPR repeat protein
MISRDAYFLAGISALIGGVTIVLVVASFAMWGDSGPSPSSEEGVRQAAYQLKETLARAHANDAAAEYLLAKRYSRGDGVAMNLQEAIGWLKRAAIHDHAPAQLEYGLTLRNGEGVIQDWKESVKWIQRAAESGYGPAQKELGIIYMRGFGVPEDNSRAYMWLVLAAASGVEGASFLRDALVTKLSPGEIEKIQAEARAHHEVRTVQTTTPTSGVSPEGTK